jgi:hypothetical protein
MGGNHMPAIENTTMVTLLGNFGFPIAVSVYLLVKFEKKLEDLTAVVQDLKTTVEHDQE